MTTFPPSPKSTDSNLDHALLYHSMRWWAFSAWCKRHLKGLKVRRALPCPVTAKFKPRVSALTAQVAALKGELAEAKEDNSKLRAHLSDAHRAWGRSYEEAADLRRRCNRLQEQLDECDCEE